MPRPLARSHPTFRQALRFWTKLGWISFGGPTGQIAVMHDELVERRRWIGEARFLHALNFCMLLPGPEAQQLATYVGWLLHGVRGGIAAGTLFVLPSVAILWLLSWIYVRWGGVEWVAAALYGLKPAVTAIVAYAVLRIGRRALRAPAAWGIAAAAFVAAFFLDVGFPLIVFGSGALGLLTGALVVPPSPGRSVERREAVLDDDAREGAQHPSPRTALVLTAGVLLWVAPIVALAAWRGTDATLVREGLFFSKAALITFGGAYAVLPYVAEKAVEQYGWLSTGQMLDGLGLAETTPGPLIMVVQFVGFLAGWNHPQGLAPLTAATLGALVATWTTFVPSFLFIFLGAPHVERLRNVSRLAPLLAGITAGVVGVILNLAVWFALHVFFRDARLDPLALGVAVAAFFALTRGASVVWVVAAGGLAGVLAQAFARP